MSAERFTDWCRPPYPGEPTWLEKRASVTQSESVLRVPSSTPAPPSFDPAAVLGVTPDEALELLGGRRITPGEVESVALTTYQWWRHLRDPQSYWVTISQAARVLHLSPGTVRRMLDSERLPHVVHSSGVRLMRRHELVAIAARVTAAVDPPPDAPAGPRPPGPQR